MPDSHQVLSTNVDGLIHQFTVGLDTNRVDELVSKRLQHVQKTTQIKGFRHGKAPIKLVRTHHGAKITNIIVDRLAIDVARKLIVENSLQPVGRPIIDIPETIQNSEDQFLFTLRLEILPKVALQPIDKYEIEQLTVVDHAVSPKGDDTTINRRLAEASRQHVKQQIFDRLMLDYDFAVPVEMVRRENERIKQSYREAVEDHITQGLEVEFYAIAERRIRLAILITEIGRQYHIHFPREEVEHLVGTRAEKAQEHGREIVNYYIENPTALAELQSTLFEDRVIEFILERAKVFERQVTAEELISIAEAG